MQHQIPLQQSVCPEYNTSSLTYKINITGYDTSQVRICVSASCTMVFTEFSELPMSSELYSLTIVATDHSTTLKEFRLTVGK